MFKPQGAKFTLAMKFYPRSPAPLWHPGASETCRFGFFHFSPLKGCAPAATPRALKCVMRVFMLRDCRLAGTKKLNS